MLPHTMTKSAKKEEKFFEASFEVKSLSFYALWEAKGSLLLLSFGQRPPSRAWKRLERLLGPFLPEKAPRTLLSSLKEVLYAYLAGEEKEPRYPLRPLGTPFQLRVWQTLKEIPYGEVRTYAWLAQRLGRPKALRAVGQALALNPLPLFFPCHRVVAACGLGGFSGGLEIKRFLINLEASKALRQ